MVGETGPHGPKLVVRIKEGSLAIKLYQAMHTHLDPKGFSKVGGTWRIFIRSHHMGRLQCMMRAHAVHDESGIGTNLTLPA
eukprot:1159181-Pelagomonas_calceolata.AAC.2